MVASLPFMAGNRKLKQRSRASIRNLSLSSSSSVSVRVRPYDAVEVGVEAPNVMGGVAVSVDGGGLRSAPQWPQALLIPHVGSPRPTAVRGGQVQRRATLKKGREDMHVSI